MKRKKAERNNNKKKRYKAHRRQKRDIFKANIKCIKSAALTNILNQNGDKKMKKYIKGEEEKEIKQLNPLYFNDLNIDIE